MRNDVRRWLGIAKGLLECPTAALMEDLPVRHILGFAAQRDSLAVKRDRVGNVYLGYPAACFGSKTPLVLVAHLDHPSFWIGEAAGKRVRLRFRGGVGLPFARIGTRVRFFRRGEARAAGRGRLLSTQGAQGRLERAVASIEAGEAPGRGFAMWDFPAFSLKAGRIVTRCCDDLLGAAAALCVLDELHRTRPKGACVWALFTRGEEIGFYGALAAAKSRTIPKGARVISLECSKALPDARQGEGVIVRVGDLASLFDAPFTEALRQACLRVAQRVPGFKFQRKLMDGGTCEATVFCDAGYRSSGLALPLGNYHNQDASGRTKKMGAEHVRVSDFEAEVRLLLELAGIGRGIEKLESATRKMLAVRARRAELEFEAMPLLDSE